MKSRDREVYLQLTQVVLPSRDPVNYPDDEGAMSLCHFCRYCRWEGGGSCDDTYPVCEHRLSDFLPESGDVWCGSDCWGFRPEKGLTPDLLADYVGQRLQGAHVRLP